MLNSDTKTTIPVHLTDKDLRSSSPSKWRDTSYILPLSLSATALLVFIGLAILLPSDDNLFKSLFPKPSSHADTAPTYDLASFMSAHFNINGFTDQNSYLALTGHEYNSQDGTWTHQVPSLSCPYPDQTAQTCQTNWQLYYLGRQDTAKNIIYQSKSSFPGKNLETFWYNSDWIYDFAEPVQNPPYCSFTDTQTTLSCLHLLYHPQTATNTPFPNRGFIWFKRYIRNGDQLTIPALSAQYYRGMSNYQVMENYSASLCSTTPASCVISWPQTTAITYIVPNWDFTATKPITWDGKADTGNLGQTLNIIILQTTTYTATTQLREKYYYAQSGSNSYGLVRYDRWQPINASSGCSGQCPANAITENGWVLMQYNTFNQLTKWSDHQLDPSNFFKRTFYNDPKLETYPGMAQQNHQFRGAFTIPGNTTQLQLTDIPIDGDYLIAYQTCPNGYRQIGAIATKGLVDYQNKIYEDGHSLYWATFCGTTTGVNLATTCPTEYTSRLSIPTSAPANQAYDYQSHPVGGTPLQFCVKTNEMHISNAPLF